MASIQGIYVAIFGRPVDPAGLEYWNEKTNNGADLSGMIGPLAASDEFKALYDGKSNTEIITSIYQSLFGRDPEQAGLDFFLSGLENGTFSIETIAISILDGAQGSDKTIVENKIAAANAFTAQLDEQNEIDAYVGSSAADAGRTYLASVTEDTGTIPSAETIDTTIQAIVNPDGAQAPDGGQTSGGGADTTGSTFTLTTGDDTVSGTAAGDTIIGFIGGKSSTYTDGDVINGGNGVDTISITDSDGSTVTPTMTGVEVFRISDTGGHTINALNITGLQTIVSKGSSATTTFTNVANFVELGVESGTSGAAFDLDYSAAVVSGSSDVQKVALKSNGSSTAAIGAIDVAGIETFEITATGANFVGSLVGDALESIKIAGTGSLTVGTALANGVKSIDASTNSGGFTLNNSAAAAAVETIIGGSGDDTYRTLFANLTKDDRIDLGGGTDTLSFGDDVDLSTSAEALAGVTSVEVLEVTNDEFRPFHFSVNADLVSQTNFIQDSFSGTFTGTNFSNTDKFTVGDIALFASTIEMKTGQNTANIDLAGSSTSQAFVRAGITVTGASIVNLGSSGAAGMDDNLLNLTTDGGGTINVTGSQNLTLTPILNSGSTGLTIDASSFTGNLTASGTIGADIIKGGSGNDTLSSGGVEAVAQVTVVGVQPWTDVLGYDAGDSLSITIDGKVFTDTGAARENYSAGVAALAAQIDAEAAYSATFTVVNQYVTKLTITATNAGTPFEVESFGFSDSDENSGGKFFAGINSGNNTPNVVAVFDDDADVFTGGAGADTFVGLSSANATAQASADVITDFATKEDKLDFLNVNSAGTASSYHEGTAAVADFAAAKGAADAALGGAVVYSAQQVGSNTFVFADVDNDGTADVVVQLTGVSLSGIEFGDIIE